MPHQEFGCCVDGCDKPHIARRLCWKHYEQARKSGTLTKFPRVRSEREAKPRRIHSSGYAMVYEPDHPMAMSDGYVLEHRKIAWDVGILIDPDLQVHHRNGDRTDNRPENLEALTLSEHTRLHAALRSRG